MTTIAGFRQLTANLSEALQRIAEEPLIERETDNYLASIRDIKSVDDFIGNDRVYRYAMKAFGLEEMTYAKAFIRRVLTEGIDDQQSFANRLADSRYRELAEAFNFARYGATTTAFGRTQQGTVDRYLNQTLEEQAGTTNEGVRLALYFQRKASSLTSPYSLLADRALLKVTQVALGLPAATGALDIDRQAQLIEKKLNVSDFSSTEKLDKFLTRFVAMWDVENQTTAPQASAFDTASFGISVDLLGQVQHLARKR